MKHIYIICITLSSLFIFSNTQAKNNLLQYAFYMPQDAFQYNIYNEAQQPQKINSTSDSKIKPQTKQPKITSTAKATPNSKPQTITKKISPTPSKTTNKKSLSSKKIAKNTKNKASKFNKSPSKIATETIIMQKNNPKKEKSISEAFSEIPYPNEQLPKYKNAYLDYILSLRILYRTKKLQPNLRQEEVLSKANTIRRFDI